MGTQPCTQPSTQPPEGPHGVYVLFPFSLLWGRLPALEGKQDEETGAWNLEVCCKRDLQIRWGDEEHRCRGQERAQELPWQGVPAVPNGVAAVGNRELLRKVKCRITI